MTIYVILLVLVFVGLVGTLYCLKRYKKPVRIAFQFGAVHEEKGR